MRIGSKMAGLAAMAVLTAGPPPAMAGVGEQHRGTLTRVASESVRPGAPDRFFLETSRAMVPLASGQPAELVGQAVRIRDADRAPGLQGRVERDDRVARRASYGEVTARRRTVAVVKFVFADGQADPAPQGAVDQVMQDGPASVAALYGAQTDGTMSFGGDGSDRVDVFPRAGVPYRIAAPTTCNAAVASATAAARVALGSPLFDRYDHVVMVFPTFVGCPWAGLGATPGRLVWINGEFTRRVVAHELGHNLGALHASSLTCADAAGVRVALSPTCSTENEYGDPWDVMGGGAFDPMMSVWHRIQTGEIPASRALTVSSGRHPLVDANAPGGVGTRTILVRRSATENFAVEFRLPSGPFDSWSSRLPQGGVTIRVVPNLGATRNTGLLDLTPSTATYADAALRAGRTFTDPVSGTRISLLSQDGVATVEVNGPVLVDTVAPVFGPGRVTTTVRGRDVSLFWPAAQDAMGDVRYEVWRSDTALPVAGQGATDALPAGLDRASYVVLAIDEAGNRTALRSDDVTPGADPRGSGSTGSPVPGPVVPVVMGPATGPVNGPGPRRPVVTPAPTPAPVVPRTPAPSVLVSTPTLVNGRGRLSRSRRLIVSAPGAGRIVIAVNGRRVGKPATASLAAIVLTPRQRRRSTVTVVASRGQLTKAVRAKILVRKGVVIQR